MKKEKRRQLMRTVASAVFSLVLVGIGSWSTVVAQEKAGEKFELPKPGADGKIAIFSGVDLSGWYGDTEVWKVDKGEIVGKSEKGLKQNNFLKSRFETGDFRLTFEIKLVPNTANSGVQFRSIPWQGHEMKGYQADVGQGWWGKLYEESARGLTVLETQPDGDKHVKKEDWNAYEIVAVGDRVLIAINGRQTVDLTDPQGAKSGIFGLQVHSGGATEVRFRNLKLTPSPKAELETVKK
jgi:hypothetical protein